MVTDCNMLSNGHSVLSSLCVGAQFLSVTERKYM